MIYLDSAATSLLKPPSVARATAMAVRTMASPGRGGHSAAMRAADTVFACREAAAELFHVPEPERVVFTMNATHALNIAIHSLVSPCDPVVISGYEHNSVTRPLHALGAAFVAMPGHKGLLGPQGTGILLCFAQPKPLLCGGTGSQSVLQDMPEELPDRLEAGTHNVPGIAGLLAGIRYLSAQGVEHIERRERWLAQRLMAQLRAQPRLEVFASPDPACQTAVLSVRCRDMDSELLAQELARYGIAVRAGLHCAPVAHRTAGTLETGTVRLSLSPFNTDAEIARTARVFHEILRAG